MIRSFNNEQSLIHTTSWYCTLTGATALNLLLAAPFQSCAVHMAEAEDAAHMLGDLPQHALVMICAFMDVTSRASVRTACRSLRAAANGTITIIRLVMRADDAAKYSDHGRLASQAEQLTAHFPAARQIKLKVPFDAGPEQITHDLQLLQQLPDGCWSGIQTVELGTVMRRQELLEQLPPLLLRLCGPRMQGADALLSCTGLRALAPTASSLRRLRLWSCMDPLSCEEREAVGSGVAVMTRLTQLSITDQFMRGKDWPQRAPLLSNELPILLQCTAVQELKLALRVAGGCFGEVLKGVEAMTNITRLEIEQST